MGKILIASLLGLLNACSGPTGTVETLTGGLTLQSFEMKNGLRLAVVEDHSSPTVAVQVWYQVGSRDEKAGQTGLAHLFEHMMFKRTKNLAEGEFDRKLEIAGAEGSNAYTVRDATVYVVEVPKDSLELALELEAERMANLIIDEQSFNTEREVVQNERRQTFENNPDGQLFQALYETAFTTSSYHWPVIGYQADLNAMKAEHAREFFADYYHPSRAILIVVGDISASAVAALTQKFFGPVGLDRKVSPRRPPPSEAAQTAPRRKELRLETPVQTVLMGLRAPRKEDADRPALEVLAQVLASGKSSRLHRALVETGIAGSVLIEPPLDTGDSLLLVGATLQQGHSAAEAEKVIDTEFAKVRNAPITSEELASARHHLLFGRHMQWMTHESIAEAVGRALSTLGGMAAQQRFDDQLAVVTSEQLQAVARKFLIRSNTTTVVGVPR